MESSEEIRRVVQRWLVAQRDGDAEAVMARVSERPGFLAIGTDPGEWWHVGEQVLVRRQAEESGGFPISWGDIEAWEEGSVGWAGMTMTLSVADGDESLDLRATHVLHLEHGEWKLVQIHWSLPVQANLAAVGVELPVSLEQLERIIGSDRPDLVEAAAADGTVTLVFTDVVDSTVLTARLGDHVWMRTVREHHDVIRKATEEHGGKVVETQGDGAMLAFASARRAVSCAIEIQIGIGRAFKDASPPIRVRIGVHTGDALHDADHFFGSTVNYAARVASHALGGEILVSGLVRDLIGGAGIDFLGSRDVELKGVDGVHRLFAVAVP
jgi:class 3 adenylate cyclase